MKKKVLLMESRIKKWGNSLALRIPKHIASDINLKMNEKVSLSIHEDSIIITPVGRKKYSLEKLLECVTQENLHGEYNTGHPVGKEVW
jgi:antitoxin MazE